MQISRSEFKRRQADVWGVRGRERPFRSGETRRGTGGAIAGRRARQARSHEGPRTTPPNAYVPPGHAAPVDVPFECTAEDARAQADAHGSGVFGERSAQGPGLLSSLRLTEVPRSVLITLAALVALAVAAGLVLRAQLCAGGLTISRDISADAPGTTAGELADPEAEAEPAPASGDTPVIVEDSESPASAAGDPGSAHITVHVAGAVVRPGVYELPDTARIQDAIDAAGGPAPDADAEQLNLAERLADGMKVRVPLAGEQAEVTGGAVDAAQPANAASTPSQQGAPALVNINTADETLLETLPGVGPATAQAIIEERSSGGPFTTPEDLMRVSGIGEKKFAKLQGLICV